MAPRIATSARITAVASAVVLALVACRADRAVGLESSAMRVEVDGETADTVTPPAIVLETDGNMSVHAWRWTVDSARAQVRRERFPKCAAPIPLCGALNDSILVARATVDSLFALTQTPAFRALRATYPPAASDSVAREAITIVASRRRRTISGAFPHPATELSARVKGLLPIPAG